MFIRLMKCGKGRQKVLLVEGYRDEKGRSRQRRLKDYGYYDELLSLDPCFMEKLQTEANSLSAETKANLVSITLTNDAPNSLSDGFRWYSVELLSAIYESLGLSDICKRHNNKRGYGYDLDEALRLFVFGRLLDPSSKLATLEHAYPIVSTCNLSSDDIYRSLDEMQRVSKKIERRIYRRVADIYNRDMTVVFYDVTNYYFEADIGDDFRKRGPSKENRKDNPLVGMGLLLDAYGMPVSYELFPGNTHDSKTLMGSVSSLKRNFPVDKVIVIADKGINAKDNLAYLSRNGDGYILSEKVRGGSKELIDWITNEKGWEQSANGHMVKTRIRTKSVTITSHDQDREKVKLKERVIAVYSEKYAAREKVRRSQAIEYLQKYVDNPAKYKAQANKGIKKYLDIYEVDEVSGEIKEGQAKTFIAINEDKIAAEALLDGFYLIVTSELDMEIDEVMKRYHGLWQIEETFRVIKSNLKGRPIFVRNEGHINAHFLICFIALVIERIIQVRCGFVLSAGRILEALKSARAHHLGGGLYHIEPQTDDLKIIFGAFDTELDRTNASITDIREFGRKVKVAALSFKNTTKIVK